MNRYTYRVLRTLSDDQLREYLAGESPSAILLSSGETLEDLIARMLNGVDLEISWFSVDGGGARAADGGELRLAATPGQPDAGASGGGRYTQQGGFWAVLREKDLFEDGFESGDLSFWGGSAGSVPTVAVRRAESSE